MFPEATALFGMSLRAFAGGMHLARGHFYPPSAPEGAEGRWAWRIVVAFTSSNPRGWNAAQGPEQGGPPDEGGPERRL